MSDAAGIWFKPYSVQDLNAWVPGTMVEHLGIRLTEIGPDFLTGTMPVDRRTFQSMGILHGGASLALAETLGSIAANMTVDTRKQVCVGQEINGNHLRPVASGEVTGIARAIHLGSRSQVWQIEIRNAEGLLTCVSRLTMAIIERSAQHTMPAAEERK